MQFDVLFDIVKAQLPAEALAASGARAVGPPSDGDEAATASTASIRMVGVTPRLVR
jgi:hypothetical protein